LEFAAGNWQSEQAGTRASGSGVQAEDFEADAMKEAANEGGLRIQALSWNSSIAGGAP